MSLKRTAVLLVLTAAVGVAAVVAYIRELQRANSIR